MTPAGSPAPPLRSLRISPGYNTVLSVKLTRHADVADPTLLDTLLHCLPGLGVGHAVHRVLAVHDVGRGWVMHEPQVDIFETEEIERRAAGFEDVCGPMIICTGQFSADENVV